MANKPTFDIADAVRDTVTVRAQPDVTSRRVKTSVMYAFFFQLLVYLFDHHQSIAQAGVFKFSSHRQEIAVRGLGSYH